MANSASESEGEILEPDIDKATTAQPDESSRTSVNRKLRDALSPSPARSLDSVSPPLPSRDSSRSPRAEKRRWDDHESRPFDRRHGDSRRFKPRPQDRRFPANDRNHPTDRTRPQAFTHPRNSSRFEGRDIRDYPRGSKRPRTRSRSPAQHVASRNRHRQRGHNIQEEQANRQATSKWPDGRLSRDSPAASVSGATAPSHNPAACTWFNANSTVATSHQKLNPVNETTAREVNTDRSDRPDDSTDVEMGTPINTVPEAEVLSIEERRKRREAIKAKYKSQANTLLTQALQSDSTPAVTPSGPGARSPALEATASPQPDSPGTPQGDSAHASPPSVAVIDDADLARTGSVENNGDPSEEPSAADYDPSMDMQEDRFRKDRDKGADATADIPAPSIEHDPNLNESVSKKKKSSDDMFASDDDDDDMFAPLPSGKSKSSDISNDIAPAAKAKELDMSLLDNWDDPDGYYRIILEELLDGRYHVQANLGRGMFSSVVRAMDNKNNQLVAIKIIRNNESMVKAGTKEMEILQKLAEADPEDKKHMVRLHRSFTHKGHLCMVFENLSINLREVLKKFGRDVGINLKAVRSYAQQMFLGLSLLRKCNILHADLKPDNMLVNEARSTLKICDLGSAADSSENDITPYLVSRFYRAPEIILGIPYDFSIDMWSVGCTLFELYTGKILFIGRTNNQMLRSIMECRGKFSLKMLKKAEFGAVHFDDQNLNFRSMERDKITGRDITRLINFVKPTRDLKTRLTAAAGSGDKSGSKVLPEAELKELNLFADLLDRCLALNPERRITPNEALKHPFIYRSAGNFGKT